MDPQRGYASPTRLGGISEMYLSRANGKLDELRRAHQKLAALQDSLVNHPAFPDVPGRSPRGVPAMDVGRASPRSTQQDDDHNRQVDEALRLNRELRRAHKLELERALCEPSSTPVSTSVNARTSPASLSLHRSPATPLLDPRSTITSQTAPPEYPNPPQPPPSLQSPSATMDDRSQYLLNLRSPSATMDDRSQPPPKLESASSRNVHDPLSPTMPLTDSAGAVPSLFTREDIVTVKQFINDNAAPPFDVAAEREKLVKRREEAMKAGNQHDTKHVAEVKARALERDQRLQDAERAQQEEQIERRKKRLNEELEHAKAQSPVHSPPRSHGSPSRASVASPTPTLDTALSKVEARLQRRLEEDEAKLQKARPKHTTPLPRWDPVVIVTHPPTPPPKSLPNEQRPEPPVAPSTPASPTGTLPCDDQDFSPSVTFKRVETIMSSSASMSPRTSQGEDQTDDASHPSVVEAVVKPVSPSAESVPLDATAPCPEQAGASASDQDSVNTEDALGELFGVKEPKRRAETPRSPPNIPMADMSDDDLRSIIKIQSLQRGRAARRENPLPIAGSRSSVDDLDASRSRGETPGSPSPTAKQPSRQEMVDAILDMSDDDIQSIIKIQSLHRGRAARRENPLLASVGSGPLIDELFMPVSSPLRSESPKGDADFLITRLYEDQDGDLGRVVREVAENRQRKNDALRNQQGVKALLSASGDVASLRGLRALSFAL